MAKEVEFFGGIENMEEACIATIAESKKSSSSLMASPENKDPALRPLRRGDLVRVSET